MRKEVRKKFPPLQVSDPFALGQHDIHEYESPTSKDDSRVWLFNLCVKPAVAWRSHLGDIKFTFISLFQVCSKIKPYL